MATASSPTHRPRSRPRAARAFTLIELIIVVAIIGVLLTLLLPAVRGTMGAARSFRCQSSLRTIAFDFTVFADDQLHGDRGNDATDLASPNFFRAETFQNSQYGLNEFWNYGNVPQAIVPDAKGRDPMRCAEVRGNVVLQRNRSCSQGGISPPANISFAMNARLRWSESLAAQNRTFDVVLTSRITDGYGSVSTDSIPLLLDVDGAEASSRGQVATYTAPGTDGPLFGSNQRWFPGLRHNGGLNVAFVDGHVKSTRRPLDEPGIAWSFEPPQP